MWSDTFAFCMVFYVQHPKFSFCMLYTEFPFFSSVPQSFFLFSLFHLFASMFPLLKQSLCVYVSAADKPAGINRFEDLAEAFGSHFLLFIRVEITVYVQIACVRFEAHVRFVCFIRKETFFFSLTMLSIPTLSSSSLTLFLFSLSFICLRVCFSCCRKA